MTNKILLSILLSIFLSNQLCAQANIEWYNYPGGIAISVKNNNIYTVNSDFNPAGDITLTKRDSAGNTLWNTAYDNLDVTRYEDATWVETDNIGNILVSGTIKSGFSNPVTAASLLMKFDSSGTLIWRIIYENTFDGTSTKRILIDQYNNIYVLGTGIGINGLVTKVKKFDSLGNTIWTYLDSSGIGLPINFKLTPDSSLLLISKSLFGSINGYAKIDLNGNLIWSKTGILSNSIGDAAGDSTGNTYLINGEYVISNSGSILQKLDNSGTILWTDTNAITAFRTEVGTDNNPIICGFPNSGSPGAAFIKYDSSGNILWQNLDADGPSYSLLLHAQLKMDNTNAAYLAAGTLFEMAICKVNNDGTTAWTIAIPGSYSNAFDFEDTKSIYVVGGTTAKIGQTIATNVNNEFSDNSNFELFVFPNPVIDYATISFDISTSRRMSFDIFDNAGRLVKSLPTKYYAAGKTKFNIDLSDFKNGTYFLNEKSAGKSKAIKIIKN